MCVFVYKLVMYSLQSAVNSVLPDNNYPSSSASVPPLQPYASMLIVLFTSTCLFLLLARVLIFPFTTTRAYTNFVLCTYAHVVYCMHSCSAVCWLHFRRDGFVDLTSSNNGSVPHSQVVDLTRDPLPSHHTAPIK